MAAFWEKVKGVFVKPAKAEDEREPTSPEPREPMEKPPPAPVVIPSFFETAYKMLPHVVLAVGTLLTVLAERIGNWAVLGFLLFASAPILFVLQRIERRLQELNETMKKRR
jgi:hypothetical protein